MPALNARIADLVGDVFLTSASVTNVEHCSTDFVRIELQSNAFRGRSWAPGTKLQLRLQHGAMQMRTYTPIFWDVDRGVTELLAYVHGRAPAATWFSEVTLGQTCDVFGPRRSIDLSDLPNPVVFIGDESSVALACALDATGSTARYVFEATDPAALATMLATLGFAESYTTTDKTDDRTMLLRDASVASRAFTAPFDIIVTGDAATVHAVRRGCRSWANPPRKIIGKAYWAAGRTGLD